MRKCRSSPPNGAGVKSLPHPLMASNTFTRHTITGPRIYSRKGTQGRKPSGQPLATCKIIWNVTKEQKREFSELSKRYGISESKLVDILVFLGKRNYLNQEIG